MSKNQFDIDEILEEIEQKKARSSGNLPQSNDAASFENTYEKGKTVITEGFGRDVYDWMYSLIISLLTVVVMLTFVVRVNEVDGQSMEPTLHGADRLLVWELCYTPSFGDIVIIQADNLPNEITGKMGEGIVKRVIGVAGDVIDIDAETGTVYRNGQALDEPYIAESINRGRIGNAEYPLTVPENTVYVLGDNRNHSTDSRVMKDDYTDCYVGFVNVKNVVGKAFFRIYPFDAFGVL